MEMRPRFGIVLSTLLLLALLAGGRQPARGQEDGPPDVQVTNAFRYKPPKYKKGKQPSGTEKEIAFADAAAALAAARDGDGYETIQLAGRLAVQVSDLDALIGEDHRGCSDLRLTFDRVAFEDAVPHRCTANLVIFNLALIDRAEEPAWHQLIAKRHRTTAFTNISLRGPYSKEPLPTVAADRRILLYNWWFGVGALIGMGLVLWGFFRLARRSNMLRDAGTRTSRQDRLRPYSLARVQTAWWFFLVLMAFLFISLIEGSLAVIPGTVLGLMGIAGGTFLGSELVDASRRNQPENRGKAAVASRRFEGFFIDIFSDAGGVAFHRFQMFVWTVVLGAIFVIRVGRNLEMPEFDTSILGLMGISSGTYLGMKIPEPPKHDGVEHAAAANPEPDEQVL